MATNSPSSRACPKGRTAYHHESECNARPTLRWCRYPRRRSHIPQQLVQFVSDHLRFHWRVGTCATNFQQLVPVTHVVLSFVQKTPITVFVQQRQQLTKHIAAITDEPHLSRMAQSDACWFDINLDSSGVAGFGIELQVRE